MITAPTTSADVAAQHQAPAHTANTITCPISDIINIGAKSTLSLGTDRKKQHHLAVAINCGKYPGSQCLQMQSFLMLFTTIFPTLHKDETVDSPLDVKVIEFDWL